MRKALLAYLFSVWYLVVSAQVNEIGESVTRTFRAVVMTPGGELPFKLEIKTGNNDHHFTIYNGVENLSGAFNMKDDSIRIESEIFNTVIVAGGSVFGPDTLKGYWQDKSRPGNYALPFYAYPDEKFRFIKTPVAPKTNITGRWEAVFKDESATDSTVAIFEQAGNHLSGTFLTTTGDYRFLEGDVSADSFYLSAFDGSHAFLFKGKINDDGTLNGGYWSGKHYSATFTARRNEQAKLPDPKSLTYLKDGYDKIEFSFPDENGNMISLEDEQFKNKPVIILITGSWCPNCMDETSYMSEVEEKYKNSDLRIVALSFERQPDAENFRINTDRIKSHFGVEYLFLNAGLPKTASSALPMLSRVMGFPTTIVLDRQHSVVEIYTGFNGPATGDLFVEYQKEFEALINRVLE